jgi:hypothetical protein
MLRRYPRGLAIAARTTDETRRNEEAARNEPFRFRPRRGMIAPKS